MRQQIPEVEVSALDAELPDDLFVLDVREPFEWEAGHIDGSTHIPMMSLPSRVQELPADQQILVVCRTGSRSAQVTMFLANSGVDAVNLGGGLMAWAAARRPLVSSNGEDPYVV